MPYFVGLDLSLRKSGVVVLNDRGHIECATLIGVPASKRPCGSIRERIEYFDDMAYEIYARIDRATGGVVAEIGIESVVLYDDRTSQLVEMHALVLLKLLKHNCQHFAPSSLKLWATGSGRAEKPDMIKACKERFGVATPSDDIADAYLLAQWVRAGAPRTVKKPLGAKALANRAAKKAERKRAPKPSKTTVEIDWDNLPF